MIDDPLLSEGEVFRTLTIVRKNMILASVHRAGNVALYIEYLS